MNKSFIISVVAVLVSLSVSAQQPMPKGGGGVGAKDKAPAEFMQVKINPMPSSTREKITRAAEELQMRGGATRGILTDVLKASGFGAVSSLIDVTTSEIIHLATYRKEQKNKWLKLIENENNYTDSISSIKGLNDFYLQTSRYGALDPSDINFDGISIRGQRNGEDVLYLSCHIDTTRLEHLFHHSKFYLVVDSIVFNPYKCHLPNLIANGISLEDKDKCERNNKFSYDEREHLTIGMELALSSSWINEAVFVQKNVQLGTFKLNVNIPDNTELYTYSRKAVEKNRELVQVNPALRLDTAYVEMEGDCFIVPRSYMPINGEEKMWGTGEYNIKVKFREVCDIRKDASRNEKLKHWKKDYKQLRKMQKQGSELGEYFKNIWKQNGTTLMKTMIKQGLTTGASDLGLSQQSGGMGGMSGGGMMQGSATGGNQTNTATQTGGGGKPVVGGGMPQK